MSTYIVHYYMSGEVQVEAADKETAVRMVKEAVSSEGDMPKEATCHARALDDIPPLVRGDA